MSPMSSGPSVSGITNPQGTNFSVLVMVKAPGDILNKAIKEATPHEKVAEIMLIAESMDAVHKAGYIHRDLKPDNIMFEQQGDDFQLTIIDFEAVKEGRRPADLQALDGFWSIQTNDGTVDPR